MPHRTARFLPNIGLNDSPSQQFFEYQASLLQPGGLGSSSAFAAQRLANCYFASLSRPKMPSGANAFKISDIQEDETKV
jgi:hypothetical protein